MINIARYRKRAPTRASNVKMKRAANVKIRGSNASKAGSKFKRSHGF